MQQHGRVSQIRRKADTKHQKLGPWRPWGGNTRLAAGHEGALCIVGNALILELGVGDTDFSEKSWLLSALRFYFLIFVCYNAINPLLKKLHNWPLRISTEIHLLRKIRSGKTWEVGTLACFLFCICFNAPKAAQTLVLVRAVVTRDRTRISMSFISKGNWLSKIVWGNIERNQAWERTGTMNMGLRNN